jgi:phosphopantothenoylcysteine decarboxylase/phosphopantothenate--cysteine ligase
MPSNSPIRNILLAVSGGIAAYKAPELVRQLKKAGFEVRVVLTESAKALVSPLALQTVSENPVFDGIFSVEQERSMGHIELANWADLMLVAPASANRLAELSLGLASDLLSTLALVFKGPLLVAPAMNTNMWQHPASKEHVLRLKERGVYFIGPSSGSLACGVTGLGRMSEPSEILKAIAAFSLNIVPNHSQPSVLITAGPTHEAIDPVRYLANKSSGKMGYELASAFARAGSCVHLISGPSHLRPDPEIKITNVTSACEMYEAVTQNLKEQDIFIGAAAVSDYRLAKPLDKKLAKEGNELQLSLIKNPDIIASVSAHAKRPKTVVGFAAQTHQAERLAKEKLEKKGLDLIICNEVSDLNPSFNVDFNQVTLISKNDIERLPSQSKQALARALTTKILELHQNNIKRIAHEKAHTT